MVMILFKLSLVSDVLMCTDKIKHSIADLYITSAHKIKMASLKAIQIKPTRVCSNATWTPTTGLVIPNNDLKRFAYLFVYFLPQYAPCNRCKEVIGSAMIFIATTFLKSEKTGRTIKKQWFTICDTKATSEIKGCGEF